METPSDNPVFRNHLDIADFVKRRVHECYWRDNINCATANLKILSEVFQINLSSDLIDAAAVCTELANTVLSAAWLRAA